MSSQSPSILLGQRVKPAADELTNSDLQQMVGKLMSILRYRRWLFIIPLLTGVLVVLGGSLFMPRQYLLRTVFERRDDPVLLKLVANSPYTFEMQRHAFRYSVIGQTAVQEALDGIGPLPAGSSGARLGSDRSAVMADLLTGLSVSLLNSTPNYDLIELRYSGEQLGLAEKLLPALRENYIRRTQATLRDVQQQAQKFFFDQVEDQRAQVARMQAELTRTVMDQPEVDPGRPEWLQERIIGENLAVEQLGRSKNEVLTEIQAREEYLRQIDEQQKAGKLPSGSAFTTREIDSPQRTQLKGHIGQVMAQLADAKTIRRMKDTHPHVEALNQKLLQLQIEFEQTGRVVKSTASEGQSPWDAERNRVDMELKGLRGKHEQYERDLVAHQTARAELEAQKTTLFERQQTFSLKQQELDNIKTNLTVWQGKLDEINRVLTAENVDRGLRFATIEDCRRPSKPSSPKLAATMLLSGAVGLGLAVALVFLRELFDRSFRDPARVRQLLGIPVLEAIGEIVVRRSPASWVVGYIPPALALTQTCAILALSWLVYLRLERPEAYVGWVQTIGARITEMRVWLT